MRRLLYTIEQRPAAFFPSENAAKNHAEVVWRRSSAAWRNGNPQWRIRAVRMITAEELSGLSKTSSDTTPPKPLVEWARTHRLSIRVHVASTDGFYQACLFGFWQFGRLVALYASGERSGTKSAPIFHVAALRPTLVGTGNILMKPFDECIQAVGRASHALHGFEPIARPQATAPTQVPAQTPAPATPSASGAPFTESELYPDAFKPQDFHLLHSALNRASARLKVIARHDGVNRLMLDGTEVGTITISDGVTLKGGRAVTLHLPSGLTPYLGTIKGPQMEVFRPEELCLGLRVITQENFGPYAAQLLWTVRHQPHLLDLRTAEFPCWISARGLSGYLGGQHARMTPTANGRVALRYANGDNVLAVAGALGVSLLLPGGQWRRVG
ncbi:hypothetical protein [Deinococcus soli (ex Cha et al. 2016)]|uniref:Uncharacterized protein n=2 Tax=Deinococcus soli (ex Cha et al. 2016) TaxID=1309411 RepID=A0ACC6KG85_9DEIO|nr:hypothetical protein [Deinococcus soli (ex Cha et al. 2016)]MDR6218405.1 hypothetical protein [Deinococcus soli (ex Cha et al. 2016)]MDR6329145.1 hypothetical protein [Deinococcus soli (ex Cha et al. 2016)]MDR6751418.1 hypothetical protein [Deinococcus soli (ex Cha et al. 2016)]